MLPGESSCCLSPWSCAILKEVKLRGNLNLKSYLILKEGKNPLVLKKLYKISGLVFWKISGFYKNGGSEPVLLLYSKVSVPVD